MIAPWCQMDGVGESVVGVQIFDTQPTIENKGVPSTFNALNGPCRWIFPKPRPCMFLAIFSTKVMESQVEVVPRRRGKACVFADRIDIAAHISPSRIVLVDAA